MDFTIFDTSDPKNAGPKEPKASERGNTGRDPAGSRREPQTGRPIQQRAERGKAVAPVRPGANETAYSRFPRGYLVTVCTLVIQNEDAEAGRLLANLFRALLLDQTTFSFASLNRLSPLNREHAEKLISAKLAGAYSPTEWERAFRLIEDYADPLEDRQTGNRGDDSDAMMLAALRQTYAPRPQTNPPAHATQPRPRGEAQLERTRPPQTFTRPPNIADAKVEGFERSRPPQPPNVPDSREGFERSRPPQIEQPATARPSAGIPRPMPVDKNRPGSPPRTLPPIEFSRSEPTGFTRTRPPEHFSAVPSDSARAEPNEPSQFLIPSDPLWQTDTSNRRALPDDRGSVATGLPARREPIINLDAPLPPENRADRDAERGGGHDKLMYGLLAIIVAAALAFVVVNYSLFYKPAPPVISGKPGPAASPSRVVADPAALSERVPLLPVSRQVNPPPRGMAIPTVKSVKPVAAKSPGNKSPSSVKP